MIYEVNLHESKQYIHNELAIAVISLYS